MQSKRSHTSRSVQKKEAKKIPRTHHKQALPTGRDRQHAWKKIELHSEAQKTTGEEESNMEVTTSKAN